MYINIKRSDVVHFCTDMTPYTKRHHLHLTLLPDFSSGALLRIGGEKSMFPHSVKAVRG